MSTQPLPKTSPTPTNSLQIIGNNILIAVGGISDIPAKIDTGADTSSIWASQIRINSASQLEFILFAPESPLYTGEVLTATDFSVKQVRSSNGQTSVRYQVVLPTRIAGRRIRIHYTLANRIRNRFPVLIGRKTLRNKFLVDVSQSQLPRPSTFNNNSLNAELRSNPHQFHQKYFSSPDS